MGNSYSHFNNASKKTFFLLTLPYDKDYCYTKRQILKHIGKSKTSFYSLLKDDNHGQHEANKDINDLRDIECIKTVINYCKCPRTPDFVEKTVDFSAILITRRPFNMNKMDVIIFKDKELTLEVNLDRDNDTVWLTQEQMVTLFDVDRTRILRNVI